MAMDLKPFVRISSRDTYGSMWSKPLVVKWSGAASIETPDRESVMPPPLDVEKVIKVLRGKNRRYATTASRTTTAKIIKVVFTVRSA
jgi:hypothetical protein